MRPSTQLGRVEVPDGNRGRHAIISFRMTPDQSKWTSLCASIQGDRNIFCPPGTYKKLVRDNEIIVMSNTPMEVRSNMKFIHAAHGNVLINGLGIGMVLTAILAKTEVKYVTVIEKYEDVIALTGPTFSKDKRLTIIHADCFEWQPPKRVHYNAVWHDIWDSVCADNLPEMIKLHRKYGRRCDWQASWMRYRCEWLAGK